MQQITANVFVETKYGGANVGFVTTSEGIVMIDTPNQPQDILKWQDEINRRGEVRYLINTECHRDHFTGNYFFPGTVVAHQETRKAIKQLPLQSVVERIRVSPNDVNFIANYQVKEPSITFSDRLSIYLGHHTFDLINTPGHTDGQTAIYIPEEKVVFTGDNVVHKVQVWIHEGNPFLWLESLRKLEELNIEVIVPGHGELTDKNYIKEISSYIQEWIDAVKFAIDRGSSKEEAMNSISFLERYPMHSGSSGTELQRRNVSRIYELLMKQKPG